MGTEVTLHLPNSAVPGAQVSLTSLPWPMGATDHPAVTGLQSQAVPLHGEGSRLQRYLLLTDSVSPELSVLGGAPAEYKTASPDVEIHTVQPGTEPYWYREDEAQIPIAGRKIGLRLGLQLPEGSSWWQWTRAERLWSGPVADAWRVGGHIVAHTVENTPEVPAELNMFEKTEAYCGQQIAADVFLIVFHSGVVQVTAHFKNNDFMVPAEFVPGLPLIQISGLRGEFPLGALTDTSQPFSGGAGDAIDFAPMRDHFSTEYPAKTWTDADGALNFQPFDRLEILTNKTKENELLYLGEADQQGFPAGVARTVRFSMGLNGASPAIGRYEVPANWYAYCGVLNGQEANPVIGAAHQWAAEPRKLLYHYSHRGGFDTGRLWRYLRRDQRSGIPQLDDAEWEGGVVQALLYDAYLQPNESQWSTILDQAYHFADIAVHHGYGMVRCHGYNTVHMPLPMMRVGGMVLAYQETGDPYLLETARAVAGAFIRVDEGNAPRYSVGRDAYPLAGIMALYDLTGDRLYLDYGRKAAIRFLATQTPAGGFSGQGNVGVLGGNSNKWNPVDIFMFSGLIGPIGLLEWAIRDDRHPEGFQEQMGRWYELVLRLQNPEGWWPQSDKEGAPSHPMLPAGLFFSLSAYHRLWGDVRGLEAIRRYLDFALKNEEYVLGTHSFLAVLYASFFELEANNAGF